MFRKLALGLVAAASLGAAAIAPTAASAWDGGSHYRGYDHYRPHHGFGMNRDWRGSQAHFRHRGCIQQRLVPTQFGPRYRTVNVCR